MAAERTERPRFDLSRILVIDLEATCWQGTRPPAEGPEIIEIKETPSYTSPTCTTNPDPGSSSAPPARRGP